MSQPNEKHVLLPVICEHCQQKQMVQTRARSPVSCIRNRETASGLSLPLVMPGVGEFVFLHKNCFFVTMSAVA